MLPHFSGKLRLQEAKGLAVTQPGDKSRALPLRKPCRAKGEEAVKLPPNRGLGPSYLHSSYRASTSLSFPICKTGLAEADLRA